MPRLHDVPEFTAGTLPSPQQWESEVIWRSDLKKFQYSSGAEWADLGAVSGAVKTMPVPNVLLDFTADSGFTYLGSPASHALRATGEASPYNSGVEYVTAAGSSTTAGLSKAVAAPIVPAKLGTVVALVRTAGKKSGRVVTLTAGGTYNYILADNATNPTFRDGWMWMPMLSGTGGDFGAGGALSTAQTVSFDIKTQHTGSSGADQTTGAVRYLLSNAAGTARVLMRFDDATADQHSVSFPIMKQFGLYGGLFIPKDSINVNGYLADGQITEMKSYGYSVCVDGTSDDTDATLVTVAAAVDSLNANRDFIVSKGWAAKGSENIGCWPFGKWNENLAAAYQAAGMELMFTTYGSWTLSNQKAFIHDRFGLASIAMTLPSFSTTGMSIATAKAIVDRAVALGCTVSLHFHTVDASNIDFFRELCAYIAEKKNAGYLEQPNHADYLAAVRAARPLQIPA